MTGLSWKITIDDADMNSKLETMYERMENREPFHRLVGEHLLNSLHDRFESESAPDGSKWQALAPATITSRLRSHGNAPLTILRQSGHLAGSFNYEANSQHTKIASPVIYAAIHHFGGEAGRGHSVTIPARPILGLSPDDESAIVEIAEDFLSN